ncbi:MAG: [LysW]-lysine hydrolase [Anaerolineae bacterium]
MDAIRPTDAQAVALLERIVRIPSVSGHESEVAAACVAAMGAMGLAAHVDAAGNAVGTKGAGSHEVLLLGHIDTVPGVVPVRQEDGWLSGRGSVDAKGPFAAMMCAAARATDLANLRVTLVGAVEEEAATSKGAYHVVNKYPVAEAVVIGEPSRWDRITLGYKGRLLVDYRLSRPVSHTAGQVPGVCETAVEYWLSVRDWAASCNRPCDSMFDRLDPSLREIASDSDGLHESVRMRIGLRLPLGVDVADLSQRLTGEWAGEATVTLSGSESPYRASNRTVLASAFLASIRSEGGRGSFVTKTGTSDMNVIGPRWECPIVAYGPGDSAYDHTPDERMQLTEYLRAIRVLTGVLTRLDVILGSR